MTSQVIPSPVVLLEPGAAFLVGAFSQAETVAFHGTGLAFTLAGGSEPTPVGHRYALCVC